MEKEPSIKKFSSSQYVWFVAFNTTLRTIKVLIGLTLKHTSDELCSVRAKQTKQSELVKKKKLSQLQV